MGHAFASATFRRLGSRTLALVGLIVSLGVAAPGCQEPAATSPAGEPAAAPVGEPATALKIPVWTNEGPKREVEVLLEAGGLKIGVIALRRGTDLPVHTADKRVSIQVLRGSGEMTVNDKAMAVEAGSIVVLEPNVPHAMQPAGEELVLLLVHYFPN